MEITKENLKRSLDAIKAEITKLNGENTAINQSGYLTANKYLDGIGNVKEMGKNALIKANNYMNSLTTDSKLSANELGFDETESEVVLVQGFTISQWKADLIKRSTEIKNNARISKLNAALSLLEKNLSEEDKFNMDMDEVAKLLA